jgi:hypothetical protein
MVTPTVPQNGDDFSDLIGETGVFPMPGGATAIISLLLL